MEGLSKHLSLSNATGFDDMYCFYYIQRRDYMVSVYMVFYVIYGMYGGEEAHT
jgi:hypothetical protein